MKKIKLIVAIFLCQWCSLRAQNVNDIRKKLDDMVNMSAVEAICRFEHTMHLGSNTTKIIEYTQYVSQKYPLMHKDSRLPFMTVINAESYCYAYFTDSIFTLYEKPDLNDYKSTAPVYYVYYYKNYLKEVLQLINKGTYSTVENNDSATILTLTDTSSRYIFQYHSVIPYNTERGIVINRKIFEGQDHQSTLSFTVSLRRKNVDKIGDSAVAAIKKHFAVKTSDYAEKLGYQYIDSIMNLPGGVTLTDSISSNWKLRKLTGDSLAFYDIKSRFILIDFYYLSCMPCILASDELKILRKKYPESELMIVGLNVQDTSIRKIQEFNIKRNINYPVCLNARNLAIQYGAQGYPFMLLFDHHYRLIKVFNGYSKDFSKEIIAIIENS